jgi:hypothetical protein
MTSKEIKQISIDAQREVEIELKIRKQKGIGIIKPTLQLDDENQYVGGNTNVFASFSRRNRNITAKQDIFTSFREKEVLKNNATLDENTRKEILAENNTLLDNLPRYEVAKTNIYPFEQGEIKKICGINICSTSKESGFTNGLFDKRMGVMSPSELCVICDLDEKDVVVIRVILIYLKK